MAVVRDVSYDKDSLPWQIIRSSEELKNKLI